MADMTWLDDPDAIGIERARGWRSYAGGDPQRQSVRRDLGDTWLDRAPPELYDRIVRMYADARMADDPMFIDDYPDEDEIRRYFDAGELWVLRLRSNGQPVGACVLTQEAVLGMDAEIAERGGGFPTHTPGENWFYPGHEYIFMKYGVVCPPLHPYDDIGTLTEYAARAAGSMGVYELRALVNIRNRTMYCEMRETGARAVLVARMGSGEIYIGLDMYRRPNGREEFENRHRYISPAFEKLSDEEYREMLDKLGIDHEEDYTSPDYHDPEDEEE